MDDRLALMEAKGLVKRPLSWRPLAPSTIRVKGKPLSHLIIEERKKGEVISVDSIHLASALILSRELDQAIPFATADRELALASQMEGLETFNL